MKEITKALLHFFNFLAKKLKNKEFRDAYYEELKAVSDLAHEIVVLRKRKA